MKPIKKILIQLSDILYITLHIIDIIFLFQTHRIDHEHLHVQRQQPNRESLLCA